MPLEQVVAWVALPAPKKPSKVRNDKVKVVARRVYLETKAATSFGSSIVIAFIHLQAHELGTPLSTSFDAFGADEQGRVSARALHGALKDIGQFRWTTVSITGSNRELNVSKHW